MSLRFSIFCCDIQFAVLFSDLLMWFDLQGHRSFLPDSDFFLVSFLPCSKHLLDVHSIKSASSHPLFDGICFLAQTQTMFVCKLCYRCNLICCLFCCPACLPVDYKGGNGYLISPCSSVNSRTVLASNAIGDQCKSKKPLSAAKACIPQILPSKFKPKLLPPGGDSRDCRTDGARQPKSHSCEDIYPGRFGEEEDRGVSPAVRRSASGFSSLYRSMHHIQRPSSVGCSPHSSVRSLTSLFEAAQSDAEKSVGTVGRDNVSSRVSEFETMIRSGAAPSRSSSLPALDSGRNRSPDRVTSAVSAEALLTTEATTTDVSAAAEGGNSRVSSPEDEVASSSGDGQEVEQILSGSKTPPLHHHHLHHLNHPLLLKPSKCKGACPASYTRFTTILRHERQQDTPAAVERKAMLPGNLFLMGPAPFRLRKNPQPHQTRRTLLATRVMAGAQRPLIPRRLSSLEVVEKLEGGGTERLSNGQVFDANGNLLAAHHRGR